MLYKEVGPGCSTWGAASVGGAELTHSKALWKEVPFCRGTRAGSWYGLC